MIRQIGAAVFSLAMTLVFVLAARNIGLTAVAAVSIGPKASLPAWQIMVPAFVLGLAWAATVAQFFGPALRPDLSGLTLRVLAPVAIVAIAALATMAMTGSLKPAFVIAFLLAALGVVAGAHALDLLRKGEPIGFEQHWGGLGGGGGGWIMLPATAAVLMCVISLAIAGVLLMGMPSP